MMSGDVPKFEHGVALFKERYPGKPTVCIGPAKSSCGSVKCSYCGLSPDVTKVSAGDGSSHDGRVGILHVHSPTLTVASYRIF